LPSAIDNLRKGGVKVENTDIYGAVTEGARSRTGKALAVLNYILLFALILLSFASLFGFFYEVDYVRTAVFVVVLVVASLILPAPRFLRSPDLVPALYVWANTMGPLFLVSAVVTYLSANPPFGLAGLESGDFTRWGSLTGLLLFAALYWAFMLKPKSENKGGRQG